MRALLVVAVALGGCAAAPEPRAPHLPTPTPLVAAPLADDGLAPAPVRVLRRPTVLVGAPAPAPGPSRPPSRRKVDLSLYRAELPNALRLVADAGRFNLVVEEGLTGAVTTTLRGVDAFEALVAIASVNHAVVAYENGIVTVRKAR